MGNCQQSKHKKNNKVGQQPIFDSENNNNKEDQQLNQKQKQYTNGKLSISSNFTAGQRGSTQEEISCQRLSLQSNIEKTQKPSVAKQDYDLEKQYKGQRNIVISDRVSQQINKIQNQNYVELETVQE